MTEKSVDIDRHTLAVPRRLHNGHAALASLRIHTHTLCTTTTALPPTSALSPAPALPKATLSIVSRLQTPVGPLEGYCMCVCVGGRVVSLCAQRVQRRGEV
jgi:hypothetical protein